MARFRCFVNRIAAWQLAIAQLALTAMMLTVTADVGMRAIFNTPIRGTYDAVGMLLCISALYAISHVILDRQEIVIDLIDGIVGDAITERLKRLWACVGVGVLGFILWSMIQPMVDAKRYGDVSLELGLPLWLVWLVALGGMAGAMLAAITAALPPPRSDATTFQQGPA